MRLLEISVCGPAQPPALCCAADPVPWRECGRRDAHPVGSPGAGSARQLIRSRRQSSCCSLPPAASLYLAGSPLHVLCPETRHISTGMEAATNLWATQKGQARSGI